MKQLETRPVANAAQRTVAGGSTTSTSQATPATTSAQRLAMLAAVNAQQAAAANATAGRAAQPVVQTQAPQPLRKVETPISAAEKVRQSLTPPNAAAPAQTVSRAPIATSQSTRSAQSTAALMQQAQALAKVAATRMQGMQQGASASASAAKSLAAPKPLAQTSNAPRTTSAAGVAQASNASRPAVTAPSAVTNAQASSGPRLVPSARSGASAAETSGTSRAVVAAAGNTQASNASRTQGAATSQTGEVKQLTASNAPTTSSRSTRRVESPTDAAERIRQALNPAAPPAPARSSAPSQFLPENATNLPPAIAAAIAKQKAEAAALTAQRKLDAAAAASVQAPAPQPSMTYPGRTTAAATVTETAPRVQTASTNPQQVTALSNTGTFRAQGAKASSADPVASSEANPAVARAQNRQPPAGAPSHPALAAQARLIASKQAAASGVPFNVPAPAPRPVVSSADSQRAPARVAEARQTGAVPASQQPKVIQGLNDSRANAGSRVVAQQSNAATRAGVQAPTTGMPAFAPSPSRTAAPNAVTHSQTGALAFKSAPSSAAVTAGAATVQWAAGSQSDISVFRSGAQTSLSNVAETQTEAATHATAEQSEADAIAATLAQASSRKSNKAAAAQAKSRAERKRSAGLLASTVAARKALVSKLSGVLPRATPAMMGFVASPGLPMPGSLPMPDASPAPSTARAPLAPPQQSPHVQDLQPETVDEIDASLADLVKSNPEAFKGPRHSLLRRAVGLVVVTLTLGGAAYWQVETQGADQLSEQEEMSRQVAFAQLRDVKLQSVPKSEVDLAFAQMALEKEDREALGVLLAESAEAAQSGAPLVGSSGSVRLERMILRDTNSPDGDRVAVVSAGFRQEVTLTALPQAMVVPVDESQIIQMVGITDGSGGGITLGVRGENEEVLMPIMRKGQILSLTIAR